MHVAIVSYFFDAGITEPAEAIHRYDTTVGLAEGLAQAGAQVTVVQRFGSDATARRTEACYQFVRDPTVRMGSVLDRAPRVNERVALLAPDVIHVHGIPFARQAARLRRGLPRTAILLQDHANRPPRLRANRHSLALAMRSADAAVFSASDLAGPWRITGIFPRSMHVYELMEGSSRFTPGDRDEARRRTRVYGDPALLWVGRLNANKDPLTVLEALPRVLEVLPAAKLYMAYHENDLVSEVTRFVRTAPGLAGCVEMLGRVAHERMEDIYRAADLFVLGSHHEGSGYALLEALSCGVTPVVTDIPSFRVLVGDGPGQLWVPGDAASCGDAILRAAPGSGIERRRQIRTRFDQRFSFEAIGRDAMCIYRQLLQARRGGRA